MEKVTMGIYFLFMAVAFIALIILFAHQMRTSKLKKSDMFVFPKCLIIVLYHN